MRGEFHKTLLETQMTRKEFLQFLGGAIVILFGLHNFVQLLQQHKNKTSQQQTTQPVNASHGFGSRKFGA